MTMPPLPDGLRSALLSTDLCNEFGINTLASGGWLSFNEVELNKLVTTYAEAYAAQEVAVERARILNALPGGDSVDPQWVADMVRGTI